MVRHNQMKWGLEVLAGGSGFRGGVLWSLSKGLNVTKCKMEFSSTSIPELAQEESMREVQWHVLRRPCEFG